MSDTMMQEILKRLDAITEKLGAGGAVVWQALVKQAFWSGITSFVWVVFFTTIAFLSLRAARGITERLRLNDDPGSEVSFDANEESNIRAGRGFFIAAAVVTSGIALVVLQGAVAHLLNPQYFALLDLARIVTGKPVGGL